MLCPGVGVPGRSLEWPLLCCRHIYNKIKESGKSPNSLATALIFSGQLQPTYILESYTKPLNAAVFYNELHPVVMD